MTLIDNGMYDTIINVRIKNFIWLSFSNWIHVIVYIIPISWNIWSLYADKMKSSLWMRLTRKSFLQNSFFFSLFSYFCSLFFVKLGVTLIPTLDKLTWNSSLSNTFFFFLSFSNFCSLFLFKLRVTSIPYLQWTYLNIFFAK